VLKIAFTWSETPCKANVNHFRIENEPPPVWLWYLPASQAGGGGATCADGRLTTSGVSLRGAENVKGGAGDFLDVFKRFIMLSQQCRGRIVSETTVFDTIIPFRDTTRYYPRSKTCCLLLP
jgi:hypothetical protein